MHSRMMEWLWSSKIVNMDVVVLCECEKVCAQHQMWGAIESWVSGHGVPPTPAHMMTDLSQLKTTCGDGGGSWRLYDWKRRSLLAHLRLLTSQTWCAMYLTQKAAIHPTQIVRTIRVITIINKQSVSSTVSASPTDPAEWKQDCLR